MKKKRKGNSKEHISLEEEKKKSLKSTKGIQSNTWGKKRQNLQVIQNVNVSSTLNWVDGPSTKSNSLENHTSPTLSEK